LGGAAAEFQWIERRAPQMGHVAEAPVMSGTISVVQPFVEQYSR
jgi:hypothetical protein